MKKKKIILIVGGTGFVGSNLAKKCLKKNYHVISLSRNPPLKKKCLKNVRYLFGDISKKKNLKILDTYNISYVVNCGGDIDHHNIIKTYSSHYLGCKNLYEYFKNKNLINFIQIGSSSEYGKCNSPVLESYECKPKQIYGKSKLLATKFFLKKNKNDNFPVVILRFFQIYGPGQEVNRFIPIIINKCLKNEIFGISNCLQSRDFIYIDDAIKMILKCLNSKKALGNIINIGLGKPIILKKIVLKVLKLIKKGKPEFGKIKMRIDEPKELYPNIEKAKRLFSFKIKDNLNFNLKKTILFYKKLENL